MANPEHLKILKQGVKAWNNWREKHPAIQPSLNRAKLRGMNLEGALLHGTDLTMASLRGSNLRLAYLIGANLSMAALHNANLEYADLHKTNFNFTKLKSANLTGAHLCEADLYKANLLKANLKDADLTFCCLIGANLSGAILTGARLYGSAREDWIIRDIECRYIYWDYERIQRSPKDRDLEPGEFELLYATLPTIEYIFENGMTPIDPVIMDRVVQTIREKKPEFDIKIDSINARGLAPSILFTVQHEEHKKPALDEVRKEYEIKLRQLESERDRYYQLLAHALDAPKEVKLINAAPGSIVATDGSTVSVEQHINNALELQKVIADEPEESESFSKVVKKTAMDIIGETMKDIAKGQVKKAAKQIIELGKDLGPIITKTAAYVFFKSIGA